MTSRFRAHLRVPLFRDGYALVANQGVTAALGLVYWLVAARAYDARTVGIDTAAISAMMFIAGVAQLNLMSALLRFVPVLGGARRRRFIAACYLIAAAAAVVCALAFLAGIDVWAPALRGLAADGGIAAWFVAATLAWCVFNLQDSALTALRAAVVVPISNGVYGVAKLVLLVALVSVSPHWGIYASWTAALAVVLVPVNALVFLRRRGGDVGEATAEAAPTRREIVAFAAPDYAGALLWLAAMTLMPLIVVGIAGPAWNAYFSVAWMISGPLLGISASTGSAYVVAAAGDAARRAGYARDLLRQSAWLVIPAAGAIAVAAPWLLRLFGRGYAEHAASTLSLLALSAIPGIVTTLYVRIYRVERRMRAVVGALAAQCGAVLALAPVLLSAMGIAGVGLAWLISQTVVALALVLLDPEALGLRTRAARAAGAPG